MIYLKTSKCSKNDHHFSENIVKIQQCNELVQDNVCTRKAMCSIQHTEVQTALKFRALRIPSAIVCRTVIGWLKRLNNSTISKIKLNQYIITTINNYY